jgi:hypothetical protein
MGPRSFAERVRAFLLGPLESRLQTMEDSLSIWSREERLDAERRSPRYDDPRSLARRGYRNFSQFDEDGIIDEIFRRIGTTNRQFVEFGVGDGRENNTMALLLAGWSGFWIEADPDQCRRIREGFAPPLADRRLRLAESFVTAENIESLLAAGGVPPEPDLLSIDIDGNDYWIWDAIRSFRPRAVVIEYNASLGRSATVVQPYEPTARWDGTTFSGASLAALEELGRTKDYALVGCCLAGVNAFFVRTDLAGDRFLAPHTAATHYEPPRFGRFGGGHTPRWGPFQTVSPRR